MPMSVSHCATFIVGGMVVELFWNFIIHRAYGSQTILDCILNKVETIIGKLNKLKDCLLQLVKI